MMMDSLRKARNFALSFTSLVLSLAAVVGLISALAASGNTRVISAAAPPASAMKAKKIMRSFGSDDELKAYLKKLAEEQRRSGRGRLDADASALPAPVATTNQASGLAKSAEPSKDESITNTQHAGV